MKFALKCEIIWNTVRKGKCWDFPWSNDFFAFSVAFRALSSIFSGSADNNTDRLSGSSRPWVHTQVLPVEKGSHLIFQCGFNFLTGFLALYLHAKPLGPKELQGCLVLELSLLLDLFMRALLLSVCHLTNIYCAHILHEAVAVEGYREAQDRASCPQKEAGRSRGNPYRLMYQGVFMWWQLAIASIWSLTALH